MIRQSIVFSIILITALINKSNAQSIVCDTTNKKEATAVAGPFVINSVLCGVDNMFYIDIKYQTYADYWFGIILDSTNMYGEYALIYTTGKDGTDPEKLYPYTTNVEGTAYDLSGVNVNPNGNWTEEYTNISNGIHVIYKTALSNTRWTLDTSSMPFSYAVARTSDGLRVREKHASTSGRPSSPFSLEYSSPGTDTVSNGTTTIQPTSSPTTAVPTTPAIDICTNVANEATVNADNRLTVRAVLCEDDDNMIYIDITYPAYNTNWFGIVFSADMYGDALIYTTGKPDVRNDAEQLYAYTMEDVGSSRAAGVKYVAMDDWIKEYTDTTNGIQVIYKQLLDETPWTLDTGSIQFSYAIGTDLTLTYHGYDDKSAAPFILDFTGTGTTTTAAATTTTTVEPGNKGCDKQDLVPVSGTLGDFTIDFYLNCSDDTVTVTIDYDGYSNNWFGIVFSSDMLGNALIWTTGKSTDNLGDEALYPYILKTRMEAGVIYDAGNEWDEIFVGDVNGSFVVTYKQNLNKTGFTRETESVDIRTANGDNLVLSYHDRDGRSDDYLTLNLLSGETSKTAEDLTLQIAHGAIMWVAWAILSSIGIMSSAFRWILPKGPIWFKIHRGVQIMVVILDIIGFIIAIVFTEEKGNQHFINPHMIIGLVVTILAVLQPINAVFRAHPPQNGWPNNIKPTKRLLWEYIHKGCGYIAWILGCVAAMLGLLLIDEELLAYLHMFLWCGLLLIIYIILYIVGFIKTKKENEVDIVNDSDSQQETDNMITDANKN